MLHSILLGLVYFSDSYHFENCLESAQVSQREQSLRGWNQNNFKNLVSQQKGHGTYETPALGLKVFSYPSHTKVAKFLY